MERNIDEIMSDLHNYLIKLNKTIENDTKFNLGSTKVVSKTRVDDVLCCIEATFPKEYKTFVKNHPNEKLMSSMSYKKLKDAIQNKFLFFTNVYSVKYEEIKPLISIIEQQFFKDLKYILSNN